LRHHLFRFDQCTNTEGNLILVYAKALKLSLSEDINGIRRKNFFDGTAFLSLGPNDSLVEVFSVELSEIS
jgi:hypothetical protein